MSTQEIEWKLAVVDADPASVIEVLADLQTVGDLTLHPEGLVAQRDVYLDSREGTLRDAKVALRVRTKGTDGLVTLKGDAPTDESGLSRRTEIELPAAEATPEEIAGLLERLGVRLPMDTGDEPIEDCVTRLGRAFRFVIIQDRFTKRRRRTILDGSGESLGELVLDAVEYHVDGKTVMHYEVEIEAKDESSAGRLGTLVASLRETFPSRLVPWKWNKLRTGLELERLDEEDELEAHVEDSGRLKPGFYQKVAAASQ